MKPTTYEKNKHYRGYHHRHNHMELSKLQSKTRKKIRTSPEFQSLNYPKEFGIDKLLKAGYPAISTG